MAVYALDYRDLRAGRAAEVGRRVQQRLRRRTRLLCASVLVFAFADVLFEAFLYWRGGLQPYRMPQILWRSVFAVSMWYGIRRSHRSASEAVQPLVDGIEPPHAPAAALAPPAAS
jgi:hypothetical protein